MTVTASQTTGRRDATALQSWRKERNVSVAALRSHRVTRTVREWRCSLGPPPPGGPWEHQKGRNPGMFTSAPPPTPTKVVPLDDHDLIRNGLPPPFGRERHVEGGGEAAAPAAAVRP